MVSTLFKKTRVFDTQVDPLTIFPVLLGKDLVKETRYKFPIFTLQFLLYSNFS